MGMNFALSGGIAVLDVDARFESVNQEFCQLTNYVNQEVLGCHVAEIFPDFHEKLAQIQETGDQWEGETRLLKNGGGVWLVRFRVTRVIDSEGEAAGYLVRITTPE